MQSGLQTVFKLAKSSLIILRLIFSRPKRTNHSKLTDYQRAEEIGRLHGKCWYAKVVVMKNLTAWLLKPTATDHASQKPVFRLFTSLKNKGVSSETWLDCLRDSWNKIF